MPGRKRREEAGLVVGGGRLFAARTAIAHVQEQQLQQQPIAKFGRRAPQEVFDLRWGRALLPGSFELVAQSVKLRPDRTETIGMTWINAGYHRLGFPLSFRAFDFERVALELGQRVYVPQLVIVDVPIKAVGTRFQVRRIPDHLD